MSGAALRVAGSVGALAALGHAGGCASSPPPPPPPVVDEVPLQAAIDGAREAIRVLDLESLRIAAQQLALAETAGEDEDLARDYWRGAALFNAVLAPRAEDDDRLASDNALATEALEATLARRPDDVESHAMLAVVIGRRIQASPLSGITLGSSFNRHRKASADARSTNARVAYLEGAGLLKRASDAEDLEATVEVLLQAERLFEAESDRVRATDSLDWASDWGRPLNLMFLGEAHERLGETDQASVWFGRAIEASPALQRAQEGYRRCTKGTESGSP
ncbi:MAG: hypothetical protein AAGB93_02025 [Planctomycetota bacterium]